VILQRHHTGNFKYAASLCCCNNITLGNFLIFRQQTLLEQHHTGNLNMSPASAVQKHHFR